MYDTPVDLICSNKHHIAGLYSGAQVLGGGPLAVLGMNGSQSEHFSGDGGSPRVLRGFLLARFPPDRGWPHIPLGVTEPAHPSFTPALELSHSIFIGDVFVCRSVSCDKT